MEIFKKEKFYNVECDFYKNDDELFMTIDQLSKVLEYSSRKGIETILERNNYLKTDEFSTTHRLWVVEGGVEKQRIIRLFNEDGIYEITFLSSMPRAQEFRKFVRKILKSIRKKSDIEDLIVNKMYIYFINQIAALEYRTKKCEEKIADHTFFVDRLKKMF